MRALNERDINRIQCKLSSSVLLLKQTESDYKETGNEQYAELIPDIQDDIEYWQEQLDNWNALDEYFSKIEENRNTT